MAAGILNAPARRKFNYPNQEVEATLRNVPAPHGHCKNLEMMTVFALERFKAFPETHGNQRRLIIIEDGNVLTYLNGNRLHLSFERKTFVGIDPKIEEFTALAIKADRELEKETENAKE
jgi:hypothetical protein